MTIYYKKEWLPQLKNAISSDAVIPGISMYAIALEGWRRGLTLKFFTDKYSERVKYELSDGLKRHRFDDSSGDLNTPQAYEICDDKHLTNQYLIKAQVPIPYGKTFNITATTEEILQYAQSLHYPLVVKPTDGLGGRGVVSNIKNETDLKKAISFVRDHLKFKNIIVQQFIKGDEIRIYVLNGKIIGAVNRVPANIIGDGSSTIIQLIQEKNEYRKKFPHLQYRPIRVDGEVRRCIKESGYTLDSILRKDEQLFLREISNVSAGGDPIDVTDELTDHQIETAIKATKAIPGLKQCGVDMMVNKEGEGFIIELNASPGIGSHLFPMKGKARDIPRKIIDYYFPETKGIKTTDSNFYFNLQSILDPLQEGILTEVEVPKHPKVQYVKRFIIPCKKDINKIYRIIKNKSAKWRLNGFVKRLDKDRIKIVAAFTDLNILRQFKEYLKYLELYPYEESNFEHPIKLGFHIYNGIYKKSRAELQNQSKYKYRDYVTLTREVGRLKKRIQYIKKSNSWKLTHILRSSKNSLS